MYGSPLGPGASRTAWPSIVMEIGSLEEQMSWILLRGPEVLANPTPLMAVSISSLGGRGGLRLNLGIAYL